MNQLTLYKRKKKAGITLTETLLTIGIFSILVSVPLITFRAQKNHIVFEEATTSIILSFEKARSRAETGYGTGDHGVRIIGSNLTIFEECESSCTDNINTIIPLFITVTPVEVVFNRISATTENNTDIVISNSSGDTAMISIKEDGTIISN